MTKAQKTFARRNIRAFSKPGTFCDKGTDHTIVRCGGKGAPACGEGVRQPTARDQRAIAFYGSRLKDDEQSPTVAEAGRLYGIEYGRVDIANGSDIRKGGLIVGNAKDIKFKWGKGKKVDAFFHSHPGRTRGGFFSAGDISLGRDNSAPVYLLTPEGSVFVFEPGVGRFGTITQVAAPDSLMPSISGDLL